MFHPVKAELTAQQPHWTGQLRSRKSQTASALQSASQSKQPAGTSTLAGGNKPLLSASYDAVPDCVWSELKPSVTNTLQSSTHLLEQSEQHVSVDGALVGLIKDDHTVVPQHVIQQTLPQQHAISHVLDVSLWAGAVLKADRVPDLHPHIRQHHYLGRVLHGTGSVITLQAPQTTLVPRHAGCDTTRPQDSLWTGLRGGGAIISPQLLPSHPYPRVYRSCAADLTRQPTPQVKKLLQPHLFSQAHSLLLCHTLGYAHGGNAARLCAADLAPLAEAGLLQVLRHLCGLAAACLTNDHQHLRGNNTATQRHSNTKNLRLLCKAEVARQGLRALLVAQS